MKIRDLRDWRSCLKTIRQRLDYSNFKAVAGESEETISDRVLDLSDETDQEIAEGMLHTVVSLPQQEVSTQLEEFAAELAKLQPDPAAEIESGYVAEAYRELCDGLAPIQQGLPAVVETFKAYAEGRYEPNKETLDVLRDAQEKVRSEPQIALRLVGEAGCLYLRGLGDLDSLSLEDGIQPPKEPLADWIEAVAGVLWPISETLEEYPIGEVELERDRWLAPGDEERIEYKKGKLARLGIAEPEVQALLLPLLAPTDQRLSEADSNAIIAAGPKVVPALIAIAGDGDSQLESSTSGGEASIRAVQLLGEMRAAEAVPTLFEILKNTEWDTIIHDQTIRVLEEKMPDLALDMALEAFDHTEDVDFRMELAGILANGGRGKPGIFERLIAIFREEPDERPTLASYLADLGDPRALPDLHEALRTADDWFGMPDIEEAIGALGGELSAAEMKRSQRLRARYLGAPSPGEPLQPAPMFMPEPLRVTKIGRNEPCPCGSGKKYKKCCGR